MVLLFKDPHGEKVFATVTSTHHYSVSGGRDDDIDNLRRRVKELETALALSQVGPGAERNGNATVSYHLLSYRVLRRDQLLLEIRQKAAPKPSSLIPYGAGQLSHHQLLVVVRKYRRAATRCNSLMLYGVGQLSHHQRLVVIRKHPRATIKSSSLILYGVGQLSPLSHLPSPLIPPNEGRSNICGARDLQYIA